MASAGDKTKHVLSQVWKGLKRGAQVGVVAGIVFGVATLAFSAAPVTIGAALAYAVTGGIAGSLLGLNLGGFFGGIKGLLTRPKPDGNALTQAAQENCENKGVAPQVNTPSQEVAVAPQVATPKPQMPQANPQTQNTTALDELKAMTEALNQSRQSPQSGAKKNAEMQRSQGQEQSWQARAQQTPAEMQRSQGQEQSWQARAQQTPAEMQR